MAQEITVTSGITITKLGLRFSLPTQVQNIDLAGTRFSAGVQDIATTKEQVVIGSDVSTAGWSVFTNLDATNYVEIGVVVSATFYPLLRLNAGESCVLRLSVLTFYAQANTGTVKLSFTVFEA